MTARKKLPDIEADFVQLAHIALSGRTQDVQLVLYRTAKRYRTVMPHLAEAFTNLLRESPTPASPLREAETPLPVDVDTRLHLMRVETHPSVDHEPVFATSIEASLSQLVKERQNPEALLQVGLEPTRAALFVGPPGVGKTMAARWFARELKKPLLILDLAAVMSSFLGRTGSNVRHVLEYARSIDCVLLLDELDAIAKRRDDRSEIGELKRLVTVLIQQIDDWPSSRMLLAATNHPDLLDPAIWRALRGPRGISSARRFRHHAVYRNHALTILPRGKAMGWHSRHGLRRPLLQRYRARPYCGSPQRSSRKQTT